jgi:hypothetical protein
MLDLESDSTTATSTAPTATGMSTTAPIKKRRVARRTEREARLEVALAARDAMRARGEAPPLPAPDGRSRSERTLRYVAYEDARRRRDAGKATPEELTYLEARFAHLSAWRKAKNARRQQRPGLQDPSGQPKKKKKRKSRAARKAKAIPVFVTAPHRPGGSPAGWAVDDVARPGMEPGTDQDIDHAVEPVEDVPEAESAEAAPPRLRGPEDLRAFMEGRRGSE